MAHGVFKARKQQGRKGVRFEDEFGREDGKRAKFARQQERHDKKERREKLAEECV